MAAWQDGQQCLVDRASTRVRQERSPTIIGDPGRAGSGSRRVISVRVTVARIGHLGTSPAQHRSAESLVHLASTVGKGNRRVGTGCEQAANGLVEAVEHGVGGSHGRQREVETLGATCGHQSMRKHQAGFRLPAAGFVFDDEQRRPRRELHVPSPFLHRARHRLRADQLAVTDLPARRRREHASLANCPPSPFERVLPIRLEVFGWFPIAEPPLVGTDPIGQHRKARNGEGRTFCRSVADENVVRNGHQFVHALYKRDSRLDAGFAEVLLEFAVGLEDRRFAVMTRDGGHQRLPNESVRRGGELEDRSLLTEQAESARSVVVGGRKPGEIIG